MLAIAEIKTDDEMKDLRKQLRTTVTVQGPEKNLQKFRINYINVSFKQKFLVL